LWAVTMKIPRVTFGPVLEVAGAVGVNAGVFVGVDSAARVSAMRVCAGRDSRVATAARVGVI